MSFTARDIKDRIVQFPHRYKLKDISTGDVIATYDLEADNGNITEVGTAINKEYLQPIDDELNILDTLINTTMESKGTLLSTISLNIASGGVNLSNYIDSNYEEIILEFTGTLNYSSTSGSAQQLVIGLASSPADVSPECFIAKFASSATQTLTSVTVKTTIKMRQLMPSNNNGVITTYWGDVSISGSSFYFSVFNSQTSYVTGTGTLTLKIYGKNYY